MQKQRQELKNVRLLRIRPNIVGTVISCNIELVNKEVDFSKEETSMLDCFYENIECDCIDIVSFGGHYNPKAYSVIVDDEGLLKEANIVMKYILPIDGEHCELDLAGTILIGKSMYVEGREDDGLYEVGLSDDDIEYITSNIKADFLGITR